MSKISNTFFLQIVNNIKKVRGNDYHELFNNTFKKHSFYRLRFPNLSELHFTNS